METILGGSLRATVAIVLARKASATDIEVASCIQTKHFYLFNNLFMIIICIDKAMYYITANNDARWHNALGHLERCKGWAIHKAILDFQANSDKLLVFLKVEDKTGAIHTRNLIDTF